MKKYSNEASSEAIYMGLDLHRKSWHLTVRTQHQELKKMSIPPQWEALRKIIDDFGVRRVELVYEAGYFGFSLHDLITAHGARCVVTPPSLIPQESGTASRPTKRTAANWRACWPRVSYAQWWCPLWSKETTARCCAIAAR